MKLIIVFFTVLAAFQWCLGQNQNVKADLPGLAIVDDYQAFSHSDNSVTMSIAPKNLKGFKLYKTISDAIKNPKEVYILDLSAQKLTKVPEEIKAFTNLKSLDLSFNDIKESS